MMRYEHKVKTEEKSQSSLKNRFVTLLEPVPIDFVVHLPLAECVDRLEHLDQHDPQDFPKIWVTITPVDDTTYTFHIKRLRSALPWIEANGHLQCANEYNTSVEGVIGVQLPDACTSSCILIVMSFLLFFVGSQLFMLIVVMGLINVMGDYVYDLSRRAKLAAMIKTTLGQGVS